VHTVAEPGGLADRRVMVGGHIDMRTAQVPGKRPLQAGRHPPVIGEHDDGARYWWRRCTTHVETRQLPRSTPYLGRCDIGGTGGNEDLAAPYTRGVGERFAATNRCR
jgi:hypothetical protein